MLNWLNSKLNRKLDLQHKRYVKLLDVVAKRKSQNRLDGFFKSMVKDLDLKLYETIFEIIFSTLEFNVHIQKGWARKKRNQCQ